ncbi:MAG: hypothetical protein KDG52_06100 [Rhodocyclaceae bacterium]|nr:hypothetical protein [Rhodocyclaceae bacterium]
MSKIIWTRQAILAIGIVSVGSAFGQVNNRTDTEFDNNKGIAYTRHNLTQTSPADASSSPNGALMDAFRNNYGQVCVYCHTPHGASSTVEAPLWNRTRKSHTFQTYDLLNTVTLTQTVTQPGPNSLTCLSCHDGTTAVDSIINMPGSGGYDLAQETQDDDGAINAFLGGWGPGQGDTFQHMKLDANTSNPDSCLSCHSPDGIVAAQSFAMFAIGTDLRNDHPVGITFPTANPDFNVTNGSTARGDAFFDNDGDARMDKGEVRLYNTGDGPEVECASCHDPHGVESAGVGSDFNPTFLRVSNVGSSLCMTCHVK